jgi:hypothetical protein
MVTASAADEKSPALEFLWSRINYERTSSVPYCSDDFKLDRMRRLLGLVCDPHLGLKAIHIAGTKGKGSTAAMIASVLTAAGYRTGLYTSPHLARVEERLVIDGQMCPREKFLELAAQVEPAVEQLDREAAPTRHDGADIFRSHDGDGIPALRPGQRGCRGAGGRIGRPAGFNECLPAGSVHDHEH